MSLKATRKTEDPDGLRALVSRARLGDEDAWEAIFRLLYPKLFWFARRRLPSDHAADDAVSEAMVRAIDGIESYTKQGAGLGGWMFGILRNVIREQLRTMGSEFPSIDLDADDGHELGPLAAVVDRERAEALWAAFARLNDEQRELLELRVIAGLKPGEIAVMLGATPGAIRTAQSRALKRLSTFFQEIDDGRN